MKSESIFWASLKKNEREAKNHMLKTSWAVRHTFPILSEVGEYSYINKLLCFMVVFTVQISVPQFHMLKEDETKSQHAWVSSTWHKSTVLDKSELAFWFIPIAQKVVSVSLAKADFSVLTYMTIMYLN